MATPLFRGEKVTGMMAVWRTSDPFTETDLNFLNGLARQAAIALDNAATVRRGAGREAILGGAGRE